MMNQIQFIHIFAHHKLGNPLKGAFRTVIISATALAHIIHFEYLPLVPVSK